MFRSIIIHLEALTPGSLPGENSEYVHAAVMTALHNADPVVFHNFHDGSRPKPYSITPVFPEGLLNWTSQDIPLSINKNTWFRITLMEESLFSYILKGFEQTGMKIVLGREHFKIIKISCDPGEHPLAGSLSEEELLELPLQEKMNIRFVTPCCFSSEHGDKPFPFPENVISSLRQKWNAYSQHRISEAHSDQLLMHTCLGKYKLESTTIGFKGDRKFRQIGFIGESEFLLKIKSQETLRWFTTLFAFAFYSGIGMKTGMGMGMVLPELKG